MIYKNRKTGIYKIECVISKKVYIGQSTHIVDRFRVHRLKFKYGKHQTLLQEAYDKYGKENFQYTIIELCTEEHLLEKEQCWIDFYNATHSSHGYNILSADKTKNTEEYNKRKEIECVVIKEYPIIIINRITGEKKEALNIDVASAETGISNKIISDIMSYWKRLGSTSFTKSNKNFIFVAKEFYKDDIDYCNFTMRKLGKAPYKSQAKASEDIVPYSEREIKRCPVKAINILTGEETVYRSMAECGTAIGSTKSAVSACIHGHKKSSRGYRFEKVTY